MITEKLIFKVPYEIPDLVCSAEGLAFIAAHEAATGLSMGDVQKEAVCGFIDRLKGNGTTNSSDIWTLMSVRGSVLYPFTPIDDSTANSSAFGLDLVSATTIGTFNNFVSGDFASTGLTGGSTKYLDTGITPLTWNQNSTGLYFYALGASAIANLFVIGAAGVSRAQGHYIVIDSTTPRILSRLNQSANSSSDTVGSVIGLVGSQRSDASNMQNSLNGVQTSNTVVSSVTPINLNAYVMAYNFNGTPSSFFDAASGGAALNMPVLNTNELADFYEAFAWYQTNVITGGR